MADWRSPKALMEVRVLPALLDEGCDSRYDSHGYDSYGYVTSCVD